MLDAEGAKYLDMHESETLAARAIGARVCVCMCMGAPLDIEGLLPCLRSLLPPRPARRSANNFGGALKKEKGLCF